MGIIESALEQTLATSSPWHCPPRGEPSTMPLDDERHRLPVSPLLDEPRRVFYREAVDGKSVECGILLTEPQGDRQVAAVAYRRGRNWVVDPDAHYGKDEFEGWWELDTSGE